MGMDLAYRIPVILLGVTVILLAFFFKRQEA